MIELAIILIGFIIIIYVKIKAYPMSVAHTPDDISQVRGLAISSGGAYGYMVPAILSDIQLNNVTHFVGTSVGSVICAMLAIRMSPDDIKHAMFKFDSGKFASDPVYGSCLPGAQMVAGDAISEFLESVIGNITFQELYDVYGSTLIVVTTELSVFPKPFYISRENYPNMLVRYAVQISSTIPAVMAPIRLGNRLLADGAAADPYPLRKLTEYIPLQNCLGILLDYYNTQISANCYTINRALYTTVQSRTHPWFTLSAHERLRTIRVTCKDCDSMDIFALTDEDKEKIYQNGIL